ncbi:hypothetical protein [Streptomyces beigongshangae]|uniref:hypothetical protein n=1 Tax=Streptomyces beigongshangae TaxID=2841597 RepID=UPI001C84A1CF|nr:hypothetical protein [Streptomyces sp. REN17]
MRALVSRGLLLPPLVCAALVLVPVGAAAAATDARPGSPDSRVTGLRLPAADVTPEQLRRAAGAEHADALAPLLAVLTGLPREGDGPLDEAEAVGHVRAVREAAASFQQRVRGLDLSAPAAGTAAADPSPPEDTADDFALWPEWGTGSTPWVGSGTGSTPWPGSDAAAPVKDAGASLGSSLNGLISSLLVLDLGGVISAVPDVLGSLLGLLGLLSEGRAAN